MTISGHINIKIVPLSKRVYFIRFDNTNKRDTDIYIWNHLYFPYTICYNIMDKEKNCILNLKLDQLPSIVVFLGLKS